MTAQQEFIARKIIELHEQKSGCINWYSDIEYEGEDSFLPQNISERNKSDLLNAIKKLLIDYGILTEKTDAETIQLVPMMEIEEAGGLIKYIEGLDVSFEEFKIVKKGFKITLVQAILAAIAILLSIASLLLPKYKIWPFD